MSDNIHIMDPVHGLIVLDNKYFFKPVLNHILFQRLRHIKQLGMGELVFPGAVHNRFIHSLGAAHLAKLFMGALVHQEPNLDNSPIPVLAALLHDIGHGPFSHAFEYLIRNPHDFICHEDWTPHFIQEMIADQKTPAMRDALYNAQILITKQRNLYQDLDFLYEDIISSQLDADRLDYLLRDAHFCGVDYGKCELDWILHNLRPVVTNDKYRLGISDRGLGAIEQYLMARRWMLQNVYHHCKVQLLQRLTTLFFDQYLITLKSTSKSFFPPFDQFLFNLDALRSGEVTKQQFIEKNYQYYKQLTDHHMYDLIRFVIENKQEFSENMYGLAYCLFYRRLPKTYLIENLDVIEEVQKIRQEENLEHWQLGTISQEVLLYSEVDKAILATHNGKLININNLSPIIQAASGKTEFKHHLYVHRKIRHKSKIKRLIEKTSQSAIQKEPQSQ